MIQYVALSCRSGQHTTEYALDAEVEIQQAQGEEEPVSSVSLREALPVARLYVLSDGTGGKFADEIVRLRSDQLAGS